MTQIYLYRFADDIVVMIIAQTRDGLESMIKELVGLQINPNRTKIREIYSKQRSSHIRREIIQIQTGNIKKKRTSSHVSGDEISHTNTENKG